MYRCYPKPDYPQSMPNDRDTLKMFKFKSQLHHRALIDLVLGFKLLRDELRREADEFPPKILKKTYVML